jgi:predicted alternative tryptophan synthase beta-subunit
VYILLEVASEVWSACPSLTKGKYCYDYGDTAGESIYDYTLTIYSKFKVQLNQPHY